MKRKQYESMSVFPLTVNYEAALLVASNEIPKVSVNNVTVEDYSYGFSDGSGDKGFEVRFDE